MSTNWTEQAVALLDGYGITGDVENTGGNCQAVIARRDDHILVITDNGAGVYTWIGWHDDADPLWWRESTNVTKSVFFGMAEFARISGWRKGI